MAGSATPDHLLVGLKLLAGANAHLSQTRDVLVGEASVSKDAPRGRDLALGL